MVFILALVILVANGALTRELAFLHRNRVFIELIDSLTHDELQADCMSPRTESKEEPAVAYALGLLAYHSGNSDHAEAWWNQSLRISHRYVAMIRIFSPGSMQLAGLAVELYPQFAVSWDWWGDSLRAVQPEEALLAYLQAVEIAPRRNLVWEKVAVIAYELGDQELGFEAARRACDIDPIRNGPCHTAARLAFHRGDWQTVIHYYVRGSFPEHPEDWTQLISAAQHLGQLHDADKYLLLAQQRNPADYETLLKLLP